jgi:oligopeptide/dipeptide ABC transporter ATP-binding protein
MTTLLEVKRLRTYFPVLKGFLRRQVGSVKAVDDVSFTLGEKETLALVGESGCGKTTTGRSILRLIEPTGGEVLFRGQDVRTLAPEPLRALRRHMQIIFQDPFSSLNPRHTVGEAIGGPLLLHGLATDETDAERQAKAVLERVGLQPKYTSRYPHEFSGGQRQRIGLARAVALRPSLIVCDEAVSALDVSVQAQVVNLLVDLQRELGLSYLFIAHDLSVVRHVSDRVAVMYLGRIVEEAPTETLFARPCHPYTQALFSAIPHRKPGRTTKRFVLAGEVPSPIDPPKGCHFHPRCPFAWDLCRTTVPPPLETAPGQTVRCHLYADGRRDPVDLAAKVGA